MREFKYCCDGGTIMMGTSKCRFSIPNDYGDGTFNVYILPKDESLGGFVSDITKFYDDWDWRGCVEGEDIKIYSYDCVHSEKEADEYVLTTLSGRYHVYAEKLGGDILLKESSI